MSSDTVLLVFLLYAFIFQPMCVIIEILSELALLKDVRKSLKSFLMSQMAIRWSVLVLVTMVLVFLRMWIMNFEQPTFKPMDNPIAASEQLMTRVSMFLLLTALFKPPSNLRHYIARYLKTPNEQHWFDGCFNRFANKY